MAAWRRAIALSLEGAERGAGRDCNRARAAPHSGPCRKADPMSEVLAYLKRMPLIAILRGIRPQQGQDLGAALIDAGFLIIEVPLNSPGPFATIELLARRFGGEALIGAGTVLEPGNVDRLRDAGGRLVVMPHADAEVVARARSLGLGCVPGFATPTEAFRMIAASANALKLFPAEGASPQVLRSIRAVLPREMPILPVGGISRDGLETWWRAGARGFGIGSALYRPGDSPGVVAERARALVGAMRSLISETAPSA
jgi:2-dehydro-3-deoxyphosphogalactonate aldolase